VRLGRNGTSSANRTGGNVCRPDARTQRLLTAIRLADDHHDDDAKLTLWCCNCRQLTAVNA
jgi:hypothetical protein